PAHHLARGGAVLYAAQSDFAEQFYAGGGHLLEILFDHLAFDAGRTSMHIHAAGPQCPERTLRENRHRLEANDVARTAGHVHFAGGDHGGDAAVQIAIAPTELVSPRRSV